MSKQKSENKGEGGILIVANNKKAFHDYEILERLEAGISLLGSEVKSIRGGSVNLKDSYVRLIHGEVFLIGCHVSPYSHSRVDAHEPTRDRKLLLHKNEIEKLGSKIQQKGLTLIPLKLYFSRGRCKIEVGVGKGKKLYDKREDMKAKEAMRDVDRALAGRR